MNIFVIPAKAGISGRYVAALLHDWAGVNCPAVHSRAGGTATCPIPALAGVTRWCETPAFAGATV
jgi:hypothetical protein